jgi:hypothetical protein
MLPHSGEILFHCISKYNHVNTDCSLFSSWLTKQIIMICFDKRTRELADYCDRDLTWVLQEKLLEISCKKTNGPDLIPISFSWKTDSNKTLYISLP